MIDKVLAKILIEFGGTGHPAEIKEAKEWFSYFGNCSIVAAIVLVVVIL